MDRLVGREIKLSLNVTQCLIVTAISRDFDRFLYSGI